MKAFNHEPQATGGLIHELPGIAFALLVMVMDEKQAKPHRTTGRYVTAFISPRWGFDHLSTNSWGVAPAFHPTPRWGKNTLFSWFAYTFTGYRQA